MADKFVARIMRVVSSDLVPQEIKDVVLPFSCLGTNNTRLKPLMTFRHKGRSYLYFPQAVRANNKKGLPIIRVIEGNMIPNDGKIKTNGIIIDETKAQELLNQDREQSPEEKIIASDAFDLAFNQGEMKNVIAGSQKTKDEWDKKTLAIGALLGAGLMFMILTILKMNGRF